MHCRIVHYHYLKESKSEKSHWGVLTATGIAPLAGDYKNLRTLLKKGQDAARSLAAKDRGTVPLEDVRLLSPVSAPCQIICQGKNYAAHIKETGVRPEDKTYNMFFRKAYSALSPAEGEIIKPNEVQLLDYEIELGLIVGRRITGPVKVTPQNLHEYIAAVVIANDISARDIQVGQGQWHKGKSYRTFCPVGPLLLLLDKDNVGRLSELRLTLEVNGQLRQDAGVNEMIYSPAETLSELSRIMDMRPGDLILTGTPAGVAMQVPAPSLKIRIARFLFSDAELIKRWIAGQTKNPRYL
ncbi:MAG: fumarylacetoacetate hydrolase family protein, partial [Leptospiraceae bacterium]|nr:fumarylacetoacetate hydrolase family protein [Leptospiraceae bacterium]